MRARFLEVTMCQVIQIVAFMGPFCLTAKRHLEIVSMQLERIFAEPSQTLNLGFHTFDSICKHAVYNLLLAMLFALSNFALKHPTGAQGQALF